MTDSRRKGRRGENELVNKLRFYGYDAKRVSEAGLTGPDVIAFGKTIEVKRRKTLPALLRLWMRDSQIVAVREDLGHWYLFMSLEEFLDILDERIEDMS
jgi:Holliday junction resolvase